MLPLQFSKTGRLFSSQAEILKLVTSTFPRLAIPADIEIALLLDVLLTLVTARSKTGSTTKIYFSDVSEQPNEVFAISVMGYVPSALNVCDGFCNADVPEASPKSHRYAEAPADRLVKSTSSGTSP